MFRLRVNQHSLHVQLICFYTFCLIFLSPPLRASTKKKIYIYISIYIYICGSSEKVFEVQVFLVFPFDLWTVLGLDHYMMLLAVPQCRARGLSPFGQPQPGIGQEQKQTRNGWTRLLPRAPAAAVMPVLARGCRTHRDVRTVTGFASVHSFRARLEAAVLYQNIKAINVLF